MDNLYPSAIQSHLETYIAELIDLSTISHQRELSNFEYRAAERLLQISIEAGIGVAKQWAKQLGASPVDSYSCFAALARQELITSDELRNWRKVIGLRNALVHDYLNIDPEIVLDIVRNQHYDDILTFVKKGCQVLASAQ